MSVYGDDALRLIRDAKRTADSPTLSAYRDDLVRNVQMEMRHLTTALRDIMKERTAVANAAQSQPTPEAEESFAGLTVAGLMHRSSLQRSKRCLLAYSRHRIDRIVDTLWDLGGGSGSSAAALPADMKRNLSPLETDFIAGYTALVSDYRGRFLDVDLGAALVPPRDLFAEVRVLKDCGEVQTENGAVRLVKNSQHYLRRTDIEPFITAGYLRHIE
ncbi:DNA replication protein psf1 [Thoreauomyces humboldtii]|nr:DNA replication protein psf1 [Thoreauomyces humboldtii]